MQEIGEDELDARYRKQWEGEQSALTTKTGIFNYFNYETRNLSDYRQFLDQETKSLRQPYLELNSDISEAETERQIVEVRLAQIGISEQRGPAEKATLKRYLLALICFTGIGLALPLIMIAVGTASALSQWLTLSLFLISIHLTALIVWRFLRTTEKTKITRSFWKR